MIKPSYTFDTNPRYSDVQAWRLLISKGMLLGLGLGAAIAVIGWLLSAVAVMLLGASIFLGLLQLFIFGYTYFPYKEVPQGVGEIQHTSGNAALAASFPLLVVLGTIAREQDRHSLKQAVHHLLEAIGPRHILNRLQLDLRWCHEVFDTVLLPSLSWPQWAKNSLQVAQRLGVKQLQPEHMLAALLLHSAIQKNLRTMNVKEKDVWFSVWWETMLRWQLDQRHRWWDQENFLRFSGIGLAWTAGYTPLIDQFARIPAGKLWDEVPFGHESEVEQLIDALARQHHGNVLLVGQPGVGRLAIIREVATRLHQYRAHPALNGLRLVYLNVGQLLASGGTGASQMSILAAALDEMEQAANILAVLDGIGSALGNSGEQRLNMTDILMPFFSSPKVRVILIISPEEYHARLARNSELSNLFEMLQVFPLASESTLRLLALMTPRIERESHVVIPYETLRILAEETIAVMPLIPFPEKAFNLLEEAVVRAKKTGTRLIAPEFIEQIISQKVGVSLGKIRQQEQSRLLSLEDFMHQRVVNQEAAITTLTKALIRARAGVRNPARPIGAFLFLGPTGVGKTETAKALAETYFGSESALLRLDMSEFQGTDAIAELIGGPSVSTGRLVSLIADHPFAVLLLDEFEKASRDVHNLFLQVFDEGRLTDAWGQQLFFQNIILIVTSNAGAEFIRTSVQDGKVPANFDKQLREHVLQKGIFSPELLNRFDDVVTFVPLSRGHIKLVAAKMLKSLNKRLDTQHGVTVQITPELLNYLAQIGYHPEFGARPMTRAIQDTVEYVLAQRFIRGQLEPGSQIVLNPQELEAVFRPR